jgi:hypothetical protein
MATDTAWSDRAGSRWGHHAPGLLIVTICVVIALGFRPVFGVLGLALSFAIVSVVLGSWLTLRRHDRSLCERCLSAMPLNPSEQAKRQRRRFWMSHTGADKRFMVPYIVVLIGSNFFPGMIGRVTWAVIQTSMIYLILSYNTHRRLQPWCPWCSEDGGGLDVEEPSLPDPVPGDRLQPA